MNGNAGLSQDSDTASCHLRVGIEDRSIDFRNSGVDDALSAWGSSAVVAVRLKGDVKSSASGSVASVLEGHNLGVGLSGRLSPALAQDLAVSHNHCANRRVGAGHAHCSVGQLQGASHESHNAGSGFSSRSNDCCCPSWFEAYWLSPVASYIFAELTAFGMFLP